MPPLALAPLALAVICAATARAGAGDVPDFAREVPAVRAGEPVLKFNGKDLTGFYTFLKDHKYDDPNGVFTVRDGTVRVSGQDFGGFVTRDRFRDYKLTVEWKWGEATWGARKNAARDSGILLHGTGEDGAAGNGWLESVECQIIEGGCGDFILVAGKGRPSLTCRVRKDGAALYFDPTEDPLTRDSGRFNWWGRDPAWKDALGFRGRRDVEKPSGQWNRMEIVCDGDTITNVVNGFVVNVGTKSSHTEGKIEFQSEGSEIFFRTIEIRPLIK